MIEDIADPLAVAEVRWRTPGEGGRLGGPPTAKVYAATCVIEPGHTLVDHENWLKSAENVSILLQRLQLEPAQFEKMKVDFLFPQIVREEIHAGRKFWVLEGPKVVAEGKFTEVFTHAEGEGKRHVEE